MTRKGLEQIEIERQALKKEKDKSSKEKLEKLGAIINQNVAKQALEEYTKNYSKYHEPKPDQK